MINLVVFGIVGLVIILALIIIIQNKPDFWFWLFLNIFFDPGGFVDEYLGGNLVGPLKVTDVLIVGIVICLISANINWKEIFKDNLLIMFLFFLFIFSAYYYIVYGGVVPYLQNDFNYSTFFIKNRVFIYGIIILISVYAFSLRGLKYFYTITLFFGFICLSLFLITLLTGFELIPISTAERGETGMTRIDMLSYGLFGSTFSIALITYILSRKIKLNLKYKTLLYYAGTVMIITLLITLTRRIQISILGQVIILISIISYLFRTEKLIEMFKLIIPTALIILVLYFTFPKYIDFITKTAENTFLLIMTGKDSEGEGEYRLSGTGDLELTKEYIRNNLLFGTGYTYLYWGPGYASSPRGATFSRAADAAGEVPMYYLLFGYGIIGAILILPLYFMMASLFFKMIKRLKLTLIYYLPDPFTLIFSIYILLIIATKFTINFYNLSLDFTHINMCYTGVFMGLGLALNKKIETNSRLISG